MNIVLFLLSHFPSYKYRMSPIAGLGKCPESIVLTPAIMLNLKEAVWEINRHCKGEVFWGSPINNH